MTTDKRTNRDNSLFELYARLGDGQLPAWLDADVLSAHAAGTLPPQLARRVEQVLEASPALAALHDSLVDLRPQSRALANALTTHATGHGHHRASTHGAAGHHAVRRQRHRQRTGKFAGAAAMVLLSVAAVLGTQQLQQAGQPGMTKQAAAPMPTHDTIFDANMGGSLATTAKAHKGASAGDQIFRASFKRNAS